MSVLVTGASGFLGRNLVRALLAGGERVTALHRRATPPALTHENLTWRRGEMDTADWPALLAGATTVFHLAWSSLPASSTDAPGEDAAVNIAGSLRLIEAMRGGTARLIFASSGGTVYGDVAAGLAREDDPKRPLSAYGVSKLAVEAYLDLFHRLEGLDAISLRLSNPYGAEQETGRNFGVVATFIARALSGEPCTVFGDGSAERDFIHVDDAVDALLKAAAVRDPVSRVFNIGAGESRSVLSLAAAIERATGRTLALSHAPARAIDPHRAALDASRAARELNWRPTVGFEDGLQRVVAALTAQARGA